MMDRRLHHRAVQPQLPPFRDLHLPRQHGDPVNQRRQRGRLDGVRPAQQRRAIGHPLEIDPAEPAQHQTVGYPPFGLRETPIEEVLHDQQPQDHLRWRGMPSMVARVRIAADQVRAHHLEERLIVQQRVELAQHRVGLPRQLGYPREHVLRGIAINQHRRTPFLWIVRLVRIPPASVPPLQRKSYLISQRQLVLQPHFITLGAACAI